MDPIRTGDQRMGLFDLFKPGHKHSDPAVRARAVKKLDDEDLLADIACREDSGAVSVAAVERIRNDELLLKVALDGNAIEGRVAAVQRIVDQELLAKVIRSRRNLELMGACFARITDRDVLAAIARDTRVNMTARRIAFENFADESFLSDVAGDLKPREDMDRGPAKSEEEIDALLQNYGDTRVVRAIGKFRGSEKALRALGVVARKGGECGSLAVEYLVRGLDYSNAAIRKCAEEELSSLRDPESVAVLVSRWETGGFGGRLDDILRRIDTPEARAALAANREDDCDR